MRTQVTIGSLGTLMLLAHVSLVPAQDIRDGLILVYEFDEGSGDLVTDSSGFGSPLDLTVQDSGNISWGDGFLTVEEPTIITNPDPPQKVYDAVVPANALSVEAWVTPQNSSLAGPARIFNIASPVAAESSTNRNLTLGQDGQTIQARLRTTSSSTNGQPFQDTNFSGPVVNEPTELLHIVYTRDPSGTATIYVDGEELSDPLNTQPGDLSAWIPSYRLSLAHEFGDPSAESRSWRGDYHLVAMWNRALSEAEVMDRFGAGPVFPGGMPLLTGDVNGDDLVDLDDYGIIRDNFLDTVTGRSQGDLNFDTRVDWADFREWKTAFLATGQSTAIPEPSTAGLALISVLILGKFILRRS